MMYFQRSFYLSVWLSWDDRIVSALETMIIYALQNMITSPPFTLFEQLAGLIDSFLALTKINLKESQTPKLRETFHRNNQLRP